MKKIILAIIGLSGLVFNVQSQTFHSTDDKEILANLKPTVLQTIGLSNEYQHICHLNYVYLEKTKFSGLAGLSTSSIVWNEDKNAPLKCADYKDYLRKNFGEYND